MKIDHFKRLITFQIKDAYNDFKKRDPIGKKITYSMYIKIIAEFSRIWLLSFLQAKGDYYFFLGWTCKKYLFKEKYTKDKYGKVVFVPNKIGVIWKPLFNLECRRMITHRLLKDGREPFRRIENDFVKIADLSGLKSYEEEKEIYKKQIKEHEIKLQNNTI